MIPFMFKKKMSECKIDEVFKLCQLKVYSTVKDPGTNTEYPRGYPKGTQGGIPTGS